MTKAPPSPRSIEPSIPLAVEEVILRSLEKDPQRRFARMEDLLASLGEVSGPIPLYPSTPVRTIQGQGPPPVGAGAHPVGTAEPLEGHRAPGNTTLDGAAGESSRRTGRRTVPAVVMTAMLAGGLLALVLTLFKPRHPEPPIQQVPVAAPAPVPPVHPSPPAVVPAASAQAEDRSREEKPDAGVRPSRRRTHARDEQLSDSESQKIKRPRPSATKGVGPAGMAPITDPDIIR